MLLSLIVPADLGYASFPPGSTGVEKINAAIQAIIDMSAPGGSGAAGFYDVAAGDALDVPAGRLAMMHTYASVGGVLTVDGMVSAT